MNSKLPNKEQEKQKFQKKVRDLSEKLDLNQVVEISPAGSMGPTLRFSQDENNHFLEVYHGPFDMRPTYAEFAREALEDLGFKVINKF